MAAGPAFHSKGGLYFARSLEDGGVEISTPVGIWNLDDATWASVVAHVSESGESSETFQKALAFHNGQGAP